MHRSSATEPPRERSDEDDGLPAPTRSITSFDQKIVTAEAEFDRVIEIAWRRGWQPAEVVRQVGRIVTPSRRAVDLISRAICAHRTSSPSPTGVHPSWAAQLDLIGRSVGSTEPNGWLRRWIGDPDPANARRSFAIVAGVLRAVVDLPAQLVLIAFPGATEDDLARWGDLVHTALDDDPADPMLDRIRALLSKAEATEFPAEAEAFTAKAHELMLMHTIDEAVVRSGSRASSNIGAIRIRLDEPYAKHRALLLGRVARTLGCRSVFGSTVAMSTVIGPRQALHGVDVLFTSLMVQCQAALNQAAASATAGRRERSREFRSSFLLAFATRVGDRLEAQFERASASAIVDALPVLASDAEATEALFDRHFGVALRSMSFGVTDSAGFAAGDAAARRARLSSDEVARPPSRSLPKASGW